MLPATKLVPTGTVSLTVVTASVVPVFETLILYVTVVPASNTSDVLVAVLLVSIIGLTVSGVFFPSTIAVLLISFIVSSPSVFFTTTVKETVTELFLATSITHDTLPLFSTPPFDISLSVSKTVPLGITSDTLTPIASILSLLFVTVISYLILLPI